MSDPVVERVRELLLHRSEVGVKKYGITLDKEQLPLKEWLNHALMECLDQANYLMKTIMKLEEDEKIA